MQTRFAPALTIVFAASLLLAAGAAHSAELTAGRFLVRYEERDRTNAALAAQMLLQIDEELTPILGEGAPSRIRVSLRGDGAPGGVMGSTSITNEIELRRPIFDQPRTRVFAAIEHEAVHAMLGPKFNRSQPRWLCEGVATWLAGDRPAKSDDEFTDLADVERVLRNQDLHTPRRINAAYRRACEEVEDLAELHGRNEFAAWLRALREDPLRKLGPSILPAVDSPDVLRRAAPVAT